MARLFGTSGVRGVYGDKITEELARKLGNTLCVDNKNILIGYDQRKSSPSLSAAFMKGAMAAGAQVTLAGLACSPTCAFAARNFDASVTVTASHNPPEYNGFKFWNPDGSGFSRSQEQAIEDNLGFEKSGEGSFRNKSFAQEHIDAIVRQVSGSSLKVVVDCNHGTTGTVTPKALSAMGCEVITLNSEPLANYVPKQGSDERIGDWNKVADIPGLADAVKKSGADIGVAHDGDGDRVFAVAGNGSVITGDQLMALFASQVKGDIVTVVDGSMLLDKAARGKVYRVPVGDVFVSNGVKNTGAVFGGEACSGTFIFPSHDLAPDGPMAAAKLVELAGRLDLEKTLEGLESFPMHRESVECAEEKKTEVMARVAEGAAKLGEVTEIDGVRCEVEGGWFLIRPSGTSPFVRLTVEAKNEKSLSKIRKLALGLLR